MADLSNLKIKNTYQNLLQLDSDVLQNLLGNEPNPFIINGNLRYVDGNQQDGYVLKSNAVGDAIWGSASVGDLYISAATLDNTFLRLETTSGSTIVTPVSYWSSDGKGNYANSGLTGNIGIGTPSPGEKLHVYGNANADIKVKIENDFAGKNANLILDSGASGDGYIIFNEAGTTRGLIVYDGGTDVLKITNDGSSGTEHLAIDTSGNIGVGTFTPNEKLTVVGNISVSGHGYFDGNVGIGTTAPSSPSGVAKFLDISDSDHAGLVLTEGANAWDFFINNKDLHFNYNNSEKVTILKEGNVGIGTSAPGNLLEVDGGAIEISSSGTQQLKFGTDATVEFGADGSVQVRRTSTHLQFKTGSAERMRITSAGQVGIGVTTPNEKLTVVGAISATTDLYFNAINGGTF